MIVIDFINILFLFYGIVTVVINIIIVIVISNDVNSRVCCDWPMWWWTSRVPSSPSVQPPLCHVAVRMMTMMMMTALCPAEIHDVNSLHIVVARSCWPRRWWTLHASSSPLSVQPPLCHVAVRMMMISMMMKTALCTAEIHVVNSLYIVVARSCWPLITN